VFPELAALYAQKPKPNYEKLTLRASDFIAKPKYANDPTPYLFLAKGLYGLVKEGNAEPEFESALEESISALQSAVELDKNGVLNDVEHQNFINDLEGYLLREYLEVHLDGKLPDLGEAIDLYKQTTLNPISINFLEAYYKYKMKNAKAANIIWSTEIPKLLKYERLEIDGKFSNSFKNELGNTIQLTESDIKALKYGIMYSAIILRERDKNAEKACELLRKVDPWFQFDKDFRDLFEGDLFSSCVKK
jgi:tetratricopeptide (TPR) repeat protein